MLPTPVRHSKTAGQAGISQDWTALLHGIDAVAELLSFSITFGFYFLGFYTLPWQCLPSSILELLMTLSQNSYLSAILSSLSLLYRLFHSSFSNWAITSEVWAKVMQLGHISVGLPVPGMPGTSYRGVQRGTPTPPCLSYSPPGKGQWNKE